MKSILLHVDREEGFEARLQAALDIARAFDARITGLHSVSLEVYAPGDFTGSVIAAALPGIREAAEEFREELKKVLDNEDVDWCLLGFEGQAEIHLIEQSALQDLIVVGDHDCGDEKGPSRLAGQLAINAKCPVLVVPSTASGLDVNAPALLAWNGSTESCVALRAALPLLAKSQKVFLASVAEERQSVGYDFPSLAGIQYLSRYGIDAELVELPGEGRKVAEVLTSAAESRECGLMVMGAYGHSRLTETLFGGVTRSALTSPSLPVLIAH